MSGARTGVLIVLEGTDGSGKGTQFELLEKRLRQEGYDVAAFDFPQYQKESSHFIKRYLNGDYGPLEAVSPYTSSLFYALDRFEAALAIQKALQAGKIVLCNRFTGSSMAHQGAKIHGLEERRGYFIWLDNLEFELLRIPRPDISFILHVPSEMALNLIDKRGQRNDTGTKHDIHEADKSHIKKSVEVYEDLAKLFPKDFQRIDCVRSDQLMSIDAVQKLLWEKVAPLLPPLDEPAVAANSEAAATHTQGQAGVITLPASALVEPKLLQRGWVKRASDAGIQFFTPSNFDPEVKEKYQSTIKQLLQLHAEITQKLAAYLTTNSPQPAAKDYTAWQQSTQAQAATVALNVLPVAIMATFGHAEAAITEDFVKELARDDLLEAQAVSRTLLTSKKTTSTAITETRPSPKPQLSGDYATPPAAAVLVDAWPRNELDLTPELLYQQSNLSLETLRTSVGKWPYDRKAAALEVQLSERPKIVQGMARYNWELLSSYDAYCQIQRLLGGKVTAQAQELTPRYGYDMPALIEVVGLTEQYEQCFDSSLALHSSLQKAGYALDAQYATLFGHRMRWRLTSTARDLSDMMQWPTTQINPEIIALLQLMHQKLLETHPLIGESIPSRQETTP